MQLIPEKACKWEMDSASGQVKVLIPRYGSWPYSFLIQPRLSQEKKFIRIPLEDRGSFLWGLIDGQRSIGDFVASFVEKFPDDKSDAPQRLGAFLYQMHENKFVTFVNLPK